MHIHTNTHACTRVHTEALTTNGVDHASLAIPALDARQRSLERFNSDPQCRVRAPPAVRASWDRASACAATGIRLARWLVVPMLGKALIVDWAGGGQGVCVLSAQHLQCDST